MSTDLPARCPSLKAVTTYNTSGYDPCWDHGCDNCTTCQSGVCCATVPGAVASAIFVPSVLDVLRDTVRTDATGEPRLLTLVRSDAAQRAARRRATESGGCEVDTGQDHDPQRELPRVAVAALPPAPAQTITTNLQKELHHVQPIKPADGLLEP